MDEQHTPLEAGLDWIVKLHKTGGFIGAEALREQKAQGLKRKLVGFKMSAKRHIARHGYPVRPPGVEKHVGEVTSGTMSPTLQQPIGLAYVPVEMSPVGTGFEVETREHAFPAEAVKPLLVGTVQGSAGGRGALSGSPGSAGPVVPADLGEDEVCAAEDAARRGAPGAARSPPRGSGHPPQCRGARARGAPHPRARTGRVGDASEARVTRIVSLWVLFALVLLACWLLGRRRAIGPGRLLSAWALSSVLLWVCAGLLGYAGARATASSDPTRGIGVGIALGALIGAPLGIALSERFLHKV